ncbi:MAG: TonB-dependent receptor plug domain-containing protein [Marinifilaceae bacterium]|nr:TonB-dependent receptor plug domain-containing protein [Marinifilaceae bacterium]
METIYTYILPIAKLVITSALLMVLYHLIYKERGGYNTNRMILLSIPIVAILLSIFRIEIFTPEPLYITLPEIPNASIPIDNEASFNTNMEEQSEGIPLHIWLIILYLTGVVIQTLRIVISHHRVMKLKIGEARSINNRITIISNDKIRSPFSYCNTIFIPMELYGEKLDIVLKHEYEHIRNKHYIDLWIIEILCTTMWFNPILMLIRKELKKVHEFQADKGVLLREEDIALYQNYLLDVFTQNRLKLVNEFNSSTIKQRFMEMKNSKRGSIKFAGKALSSVALATIFAMNTFAIGEQQTIITIDDKNSQLEIRKQDTTNTEKNDICVIGVSTKKLEQPYQIPNAIQTESNVIVKDSRVTKAPLYVVDGVIYESHKIKDLDPQKIESIDVLPEGATSVYGEKGANGVIVVTTKKEEPKQDAPTTLLAKIMTLDNTLNIDSTIFIIGEPTVNKVTKHDLKWIQETTNKPSLFLINNRVYSVNLLTGMFNHIDESQITGITILKDNSAVKAFGVIPGTHVVMIDYNGKIDDNKVFESFDSQNYFGARILNKWGKRSVKQINKKANPKHI